MAIVLPLEIWLNKKMQYRRKDKALTGALIEEEARNKVRTNLGGTGQEHTAGLRWEITRRCSSVQTPSRLLRLT